MTSLPFARLLSTLSYAALVACGESSGTVLERIPERPDDPDLPPGTSARVALLIVSDITACAVGDSCGSNDPDSRNNRCFTVSDDDGPRASFRADSVDFVGPDDARVEEPEDQCFRLTLNDEEIVEIRRGFDELEHRVFTLSRGVIALDVVPHLLAPMIGGIEGWQDERGSGFILAARNLESALPFLSRETDFVFSVTGSRDREAGLSPSMEHCAGTGRDASEPELGTEYTWLAVDCVESDVLLRHWLFQVYFALRDVNGFRGHYDDTRYPDRCDPDSAVDPADWFPWPDDCAEDPDAPTCGDYDCEGSDDEFAGHLLTAHWPRERVFVGNHCRNGVRDYSEESIDRGGICAELGQ